MKKSISVFLLLFLCSINNSNAYSSQFKNEQFNLPYLKSPQLSSITEQKHFIFEQLLYLKRINSSHFYIPKCELLNINNGQKPFIYIFSRSQKLASKAIYILLILTTLGLLFLIIRIKREKKSLIKRLLEKKNSIKAKLTEIEMLKNQNIEFKNQIAQKDEMLNNYEQDLEAIKEKYNNKIEESLKIESNEELRSCKILTSDDWTNFVTLFRKRNEHLYLTLFNLSPKLTESELRYLMLTSIGLDNKEIANTIGISSDSVRVTWSRLKKKFSDQEVNDPNELIQIFQMERI